VRLALHTLERGISGFAVGVVVIASFWYLVSGGKLKVHGPLALLYMTFFIPFGICSEVFCGFAYEATMGSQIYHYDAFPIYAGYSSVYDFVGWALYGLHFYLAHAFFSLRPKYKVIGTVLLIAFSGVVLEAMGNVLMHAAVGKYLFHYPHGSLWNVTSLRLVPYYALFTWVGLQVLRRLSLNPGTVPRAVGYLVLGIAVVYYGIYLEY
jgi:hypothetical protein